MPNTLSAYNLLLHLSGSVALWRFFLIACVSLPQLQWSRLHIELPTSHTIVAIFNPLPKRLVQFQNVQWNLDSETPRDSKNAFLHAKGVSGTFKA